MATFAAIGIAMLAVGEAVPAEGSARPPKPVELLVWITGNPEDAAVELSGGPAILLMGGGPEVDEAFAQRAYPIVNGGDVVVLRTSGSDGYNDYLFTLGSAELRPDSVETMLVTTTDLANSDYVEWVCETAEMIWVAGGDQSEYTAAWRDTKLAAAVMRAHERGAVIGGTSAGCMIMGEFVYDPREQAGITSDEAIADPYRGSMIITGGLFGAPLTRGIITDTHFYERDRMGRLMAMMARLREDGRTESIIGLAVSEETALFIDQAGVAVVDGRYEAFLLREAATTYREQVSPGEALVYRGLLRTKLEAGDRYDLGSLVSTRSPIELSVNGEAPGEPYTPTDPYADEAPNVGGGVMAR